MKTSVQDFMKPWAKLCAAYPRFEFGKATVAEFYESLSRFSVDKLMAAVTIAKERSEFPPSIKMLIEIIEHLPAPKQALLEAPRPRPEEIAKAQAILQTLVHDMGAVDDERRAAKIAQRRAVLKEQAAMLLAEGGM